MFFRVSARNASKPRFRYNSFKRKNKLMHNQKYLTKEAVFKRGLEILNIPLKQIDKTNRLKTGKGAIGTVIEESWFGYTPNSGNEPDFSEAGVELKVTPYLRGKQSIRAKERLVCNIINYQEEYKKTFWTSSFWHKCNTMLLMFYEYLPGQDKGNFKIDHVVLFNFPKEDLAIIKRDWETIMYKVRVGKAHEISEGDTLYLAACTKGMNASSLRSQPFSHFLAKQRAYSLKASYMTQLLNKYIFGQQRSPRIIKSTVFLKSNSLENYIIQKISPFYGKTQEQLKKFFDISSHAKNINELLLSKMLGITGHISHSEEFQKAGIIPKTIRVQRNGKVKESMSFPAFDFIHLSQEPSWEESELYAYLSPTKFLFVIFQEQANGEYVFTRIMFWNMPIKDLEEVHKVWKRTQEIIREGVELSYSGAGIQNNFPKMAENSVAHVRPHARNSDDTLALPDGRCMTKQSFWLNNNYITKQIQKEINPHL